VTDFLLFTLYAPLVSWGDIAVGESRGSWDRPSRSAVLGLLGAALGIEREHQEAHDALASDYGVAVRLDAAGATLSDYHTAQTVAASAVKRARPRTRAALLASGERETILSRRAYRQDALATAALWARGGARWTLQELADALRRPAFVLYAGRKANALGAPLDPAVSSAATLKDVFATREPAPRALDARRIVGRSGWGREVAHDEIRQEDGFESGLIPFRRDVRRDVPVHRARWQFAERVVEVGLLDRVDVGAGADAAINAATDAGGLS
jgi:CRISPR system Cascade subunit CasD